MATIRQFNRNDPSKGFVVGVSRNGVLSRKWFKTHAEATAYSTTLETDPVGVESIIANRNELLYCQDRCKEYGVSMREVVDFYALHGARRSNPTVVEAINALLLSKRQAGRKETYITSINKHLNKFVEYVGPETKMGSIIESQVSNFIYEKHQHVNEVTKLNLIRNLSVLYNFALKKHYVGINPLTNIERPEEKYEVPKILSPEDMTTLLNRCYKKGWYDRLTIFVLVGFCGIRTEEAAHLTWSDINLVDGFVTVPARIAKKGSHRINPIPPNALQWLRTVEDKRQTGPIIGLNFVALLRSAVKYAHINHTKNCIRHSFCSYALKAGWTLADVVAYMGHSNPKMIHSHYRNVVQNQQDAVKYWAIVPTI